MTGIDLHETMDRIAAHAGAPPADLLERVEAGRLRRRRRVAVAAFAAIVLIAGAVWAGTRPLVERADTPARPTGYAPLRVPPSVVDPPMIWHTWRGDLYVAAQEPPTLPDGTPVRLLDMVDAGMLMGDKDNFYALSMWDRLFRPVVTGTGVDATAHPDWIVATPLSIVWLADRGDGSGMSVYRSPQGGASKQLVTVVQHPGEDVRGLFATEDHAYWSTRDGVQQVSLSDGSTGPLAGYETLATDGTAWASGPPPDPATGARPRPAVYKHLVTGEERPVRPAPEADAARMRCVPAFCVAPPADGGDVWLLQRPDGSQLTRLPTPGAPGAIGATADGGLITLADGVLLDPVSGRYGIPGRTTADLCPQRSGAVKEDFAYRWSDRSGEKCGPPQVTIISAGN